MHSTSWNQQAATLNIARDDRHVTRGALEQEMEHRKSELYVETSSETHGNSENAQDAVRRRQPEYPPFVIKTVRKAQSHLRERGEPAGAKFLMVFLSKMSDNPTRYQVFDAAIRMFLRSRAPMAAVMCYTRMSEEGFICPISLRAQMDVISLANHLPTHDDLLTSLQEWFRNPRYDEDALQDMLFLLEETLSVEPALIDKVAELFLAQKGPTYSFTRSTISWLVHVHARVGDVAGSRRWLEPERHVGATQPHPYTSLVRSAAENDDEETYRWVVQQMKELDIKPDLAFYNAMIAAELRQHRYANAFKIYRLLLMSGNRSFTPDGRTFPMLFKATLYLCRPRSVRIRRVRPSHILTPRELFKEMVWCHLFRERGGLTVPVLWTTSVEHALRTFMKARDYAAAFIVLKAMQACDIPITMGTYRWVILPIVSGMKDQLPLFMVEDNPNDLWAYRFLGMSTALGPMRPAADLRLVDSVLQMGTISRLQLRYVPPTVDLYGTPTPSAAQRVRDNGSPMSNRDALSNIKFKSRGRPSAGDAPRPNIPSARELARAGPLTLDVQYDIKPLERILRRAILASHKGAVYRPMTEVNLEIAEAKADMIGDLPFNLPYNTGKDSRAGSNKSREAARQTRRKISEAEYLMKKLL